MDIRINNIEHDYGDHKAIKQLSMRAGDGEMVVILGPSGCGKTTLLRLIAGLIPVQQGEIYFHEQDVSLWPPQKRNAVMVFQSYALFPHLTVEENIRYGLQMRKTKTSMMQEQVKKIMEKVQLSDFGQRTIQQLSGGQQQRVALARALVVEPSVLLFDEPLSNLDQKLRTTMRQEIRTIQKELGITSLYVTHDQEEAMAIADRIVIMKDGQIEQIGHPREVYEKPVNRFVASFMGDCNFFEQGQETTMCRPNAITISREGEEVGKVCLIEFLGSIQRVKIIWHERELVIESFVRQSRDYPFDVGDLVCFSFDEGQRQKISD